MKKLFSILAALLILPAAAGAVDLSADLAGGAGGQGFASVVSAGGTLTYTILVNGVGTPNRAVILQGGEEVVDLGATFNFGTARGSVGASTGDLNSNADSYTLRVEGDADTVEGPFFLVAAQSLVLTPPIRNYGDVTVGTTTAPRRITVINESTENVRIRSVQIRGVNRDQYALVGNTCDGVNLRPGQSCTIDPVFSPTAEGFQRALAVVFSNDLDSGDIRAPLRGNAVP